jgi:hypothetical protein
LGFSQNELPRARLFLAARVSGGDARRFLHSHGSFPEPMHNPA